MLDKIWTIKKLASILLLNFILFNYFDAYNIKHGSRLQASSTTTAITKKLRDFF